MEVVTAMTQRNTDPAFGGAPFQEANGGADANLYEFVQNPFKGTLISAHSELNIPSTLTFFSCVFGGGQHEVVKQRWQPQ